MSEILAGVRRAKIEPKASQGAPVARPTISAPASANVARVADDLVDALTVTDLALIDRHGDTDVTVELA